MTPRTCWRLRQTGKWRTPHPGEWTVSDSLAVQQKVSSHTVWCNTERALAAHRPVLRHVSHLSRQPKSASWGFWRPPEGRLAAFCGSVRQDGRTMPFLQQTPALGHADTRRRPKATACAACGFPVESQRSIASPCKGFTRTPCRAPINPRFPACRPELAIGRSESALALSGSWQPTELRSCRSGRACSPQAVPHYC